MRDKIGDHEDAMDSIFYRLKRLEDNSYEPQNFSERLEEFKEVVKQKIIDLDFRINELELQFEEIKQRGRPRQKNG
jgi:vacuolar-type H+-ATPase subunit I/STV1